MEERTSRGRERQPHVTAPPPRLRGFLHVGAFVATVPLGVVLVLAAPTTLARDAAIPFAASVVAMFGVSGLFHRLRWTPPARSRMAIVDHTMIYALIAGTYTPFALLVLHPGWRIPTVVVVWSVALCASAAKLRWRHAPAWVAASTCVAMGWGGVVMLPQIVGRIGVGGTSLLLGGGLAYTIGAVVYARRHPDPFPHMFGYHEIFHGLVVVAVACQYATVAFFVLPSSA